MQDSQDCNPVCWVKETLWKKCGKYLKIYCIYLLKSWHVEHVADKSQSSKRTVSDRAALSWIWGCESQRAAPEIGGGNVCHFSTTYSFKTSIISDTVSISLSARTQVCSCISPVLMSSNVMNLVEEEWIDVSLATKATNGISVFSVVFIPQPKKKKKGRRINNMSFWFGFTSLSLLSCCWPFCKHALPLCYWCPKQFIKWNAKADICSFLVAWLAEFCNMPFVFHVTPPGPWKPLPPLHRCSYLVQVSICFAIFFFFLTPRQSGPEDLTFKWQLFPDLFKKSVPVLCPARWDKIRGTAPNWES